VEIDPETCRDWLERYAHQTLSLADDFVHLARAESGRFLFETFSLGDALLDAVDDLWPLAGARQIRVTTQVPEDEALVTGDRSLITRAIANLLGNAIKYSEANTEIAANVRRDGADWVLEIADQGRGIAASDLPLLFEPFRRLAAPETAPATSAPPGAGLGLAFVKAVIERHRGQVVVRPVVMRTTIGASGGAEVSDSQHGWTSQPWHTRNGARR